MKGEGKSARGWASKLMYVVAGCAAGIIGSPGTAQALVGPVPTGFDVVDNTCQTWDVNVTYTAQELSPGQIAGLEGFERYTARDHLHYSGSYPFLTIELRGFANPDDAAAKVGEINRDVFQNPQPKVGSTAVVMYGHSAACAADAGLRECVGIVLGHKQYMQYHKGEEPTMFPMGSRCFKLPPARGSCYFDVPSATRDLGTIGPKGGGTDIPLTYRCTGSPPKYQIRKDGGGSMLAVTPPVGTVALTADGKTLPVGVDVASGAHTVTLHAVFSPTSGKSGAFQAVGTVILDLQ